MNIRGPLPELLWIDVHTTKHVGEQVTELQLKAESSPAHSPQYNPGFIRLQNALYMLIIITNQLLSAGKLLRRITGNGLVRKIAGNQKPSALAVALIGIYRTAVLQPAHKCAIGVSI